MRHFLLLLLPLALFTACQPDEDAPTDVDDPPPTPPVVIARPEVRAGIHDSTYTYQAFTPGRHLTVIWDSVNLYGTAVDSLDLLGDGDADVRIEMSLLNLDSLHLLGGGMPSPFPHVQVSPLGDWEVGLCREVTGIGLGGTATWWFGDTLTYNDRIDNLQDWRTAYEAPHNNVSLWSENPGWVGTPSLGSWYLADGVRYLPIRLHVGGLKVYRYGWIEIDISDPRDPVFLRYAVEG